MFTLVDYVRLSQGYIRGRFVFKQQQFLIGRAASVQSPALIHPWIIEQFDLVSGQVSYLNIDSFLTCLYVFSNCLHLKNFHLPKGSLLQGKNFFLTFVRTIHRTSDTTVKFLLLLGQRISYTHYL